MDVERGNESMRNVLAVHLFHPRGGLHGVVDDREVCEVTGLEPLDVCHVSAPLSVPVRSEVGGLDDDPVGSEQLRARDGLHADVIDPLRVGLVPFSVPRAPRLLRALTCIDGGGGDGLPVDRDSDVEEGAVRHIALVAGDCPVFHRRRERSVDVLRVDAGPPLHYRDLPGERGEDAVDEAVSFVVIGMGHGVTSARAVNPCRHTDLWFIQTFFRNS